MSFIVGRRIAGSAALEGGKPVNAGVPAIGPEPHGSSTLGDFDDSIIWAMRLSAPCRIMEGVSRCGGSSGA